jgi:hypothetical protein
MKATNRAGRTKPPPSERSERFRGARSCRERRNNGGSIDPTAAQKMMRAVRPHTNGTTIAIGATVVSV